MNCSPADGVVRFTSRTAAAAFSATQITVPSLDIAIFCGSLPTKIGVPSAPVLGSIGTMLFPSLGPPLSPTEAYSNCVALLYTKAFAGREIKVVKTTGEEVPPPGDGLTTVTLLLPRVWVSVIGTVAVSWFALANVVTSGEPFHRTTEVGTKFEPDKVSVKLGPPIAADAGETPDSVGTGFGTTLIFTAFETNEPGLLTVTERDPTDAKFAAGIMTKITVGFQLLGVRLVPFTRTVEKDVKPLP